MAFVETPGRPGWYPAPAKLNLMLRVLGRRQDGYHLLQTIFQFIDLYDWLAFESVPGRVSRRLSGLEQVPLAEDLCLRAIQRLQDMTGLREGVGVHVDKQIPLGGGLGGGSSDAATTLLALNQLLNLKLSLDDLADIGLGLGADVPVFIRGQAAWAEGVGEQLQPLPDLPQSVYLLVHPGVHVSTAQVFNAPSLRRDHAPITPADYFAGDAVNTLQAQVAEAYPAVAEALAWLANKTQQPMLTGTGACVFGRCDGLETAQRHRAAVPAVWQGFAVRSYNQHPLGRSKNPIRPRWRR